MGEIEQKLPEFVKHNGRSMREILDAADQGHSNLVQKLEKEMNIKEPEEPTWMERTASYFKQMTFAELINLCDALCKEPAPEGLPEHYSLATKLSSWAGKNYKPSS